MHPGQRNSLDALCRRYTIDNSQRDLHGALLDAEILADVYLAMTGGQVSLSLDADGSQETAGTNTAGAIRRLPADRPRLCVIRATEEEITRHESRLDAIAGACDGKVVWRNADS
jgi:DNA polymerase-3 subunit epsilon